MEIQVRVTKILEPLSFVSKKTGETTFKHSFVGETKGQYPKVMCFTVFGGDKFRQMGISVGNDYNVSFDAESREWNGKYFTELQAWRVVSLATNFPQQGGQQEVPQPQTQSPIPQEQPQSSPAPQESEGSDLPF